MKKCIIITGAFILFMTVALPHAKSAESYDGIWSIRYNGVDVGYASIHQNGQQLVFIALGSDMEWEALYGSIINNKGTLNTVISGVNLTIKIEFNSSMELSFTQISCVAKEQLCNFPNGATFKAVKFF